MDRTICAKESSPVRGCLTSGSGKSFNRSGSSRPERFRRMIGDRKELGAHERLGRRLVGLGTRVRCRARAAHVKQTPMCAASRIGRACRRLRMSLSGLWLHHGLRGGCAAPEPEAVTGATHLFRCPVWHLGGLGCALHPNLRGGSLRSINPMREGQTASRNGRVPVLAADAGQPDGQVVGQRVLQRLEAALDTLPGRTVGWE